MDRLNSRKFNIQHLEIEIRTLRVVIKFSLMEEGGGCRFRKVATISKFREAKDFKGKLFASNNSSRRNNSMFTTRGVVRPRIALALINYAKFITTLKAEPITSCDFQRWLVADFTLEHAPKLPSNFRHAASRVILSDTIRVCRYARRTMLSNIYIGIICARASFHPCPFSDNVPIKSLRVSRRARSYERNNVRVNRSKELVVQFLFLRILRFLFFSRDLDEQTTRFLPLFSYDRNFRPD